MKNPQIWYVRHQQKLLGPYPAGLVSQYLLLGRFRETDEVSTDREQWMRIFEVEALIPPVLREARANPGDADAQARLEAAKRWADERRGPLAHLPPEHERRKDESVQTVSLRETRAGRPAAIRQRRVIEYVAIAAAVALVIGAPFLMPSPTSITASACDTPPAPAVVWSNCNMATRDLANADLSGADLSSIDLNGSNLRGASLREANMAYAELNSANLRGANLSGARLTGATLRGADLSDANLAGADLSYAVLSGANLTGADLTGARLDKAEWSAGIECLPGSIGACQR